MLSVQAPAAPASSPAETPEVPITVSFRRIRDMLKKPDVSRLTAPRPQADFSVEILEKQKFEDLLTLLGLGGGSPMPTVLFGGAASRPSSAADLTGLGRAALARLSKSRKARAERLAREEVARDLIAFCTLYECLPQKR